MGQLFLFHLFYFLFFFLQRIVIFLSKTLNLKNNSLLYFIVFRLTSFVNHILNLPKNHM